MRLVLNKLMTILRRHSLFLAAILLLLMLSVFIWALLQATILRANFGFSITMYVSNFGLIVGAGLLITLIFIAYHSFRNMLRNSSQQRLEAWMKDLQHEIKREVQTIRPEETPWKIAEVLESFAMLARLQRGIPLYAVDIKPLLLQTATRTYGFPLPTRVTWDWAIDNPTYSVKGDSALLSRAFLNLFENEKKYGKQGSLHIRVYASRERTYVVMNDSGIGIPEGVERSILAGKRDPRIQNMIEGSGIGLRLVQTILKVHGGSIEILAMKKDISKPDERGAGFVITLQTASASLAPYFNSTLDEET